LGAICRHAENFDRAQIGGDECQAGDPSGQGTPGKQEILAGSDSSPGKDSDGDD
jgi:hypothetical protein